MQSAKDHLKKFTSKSGQEDTTVHENVVPAVQNETVSREQHDKIIPAVDREVHQHHYHTTEQPVHHQERLEEQHHHKAIPVEKREFTHGNDEETKRKLETQAAQYRNTSERVEGHHTKSHEAGIEGQHTHHHVHETVQPVIQKQTVEPHVVHTTVPIHEVHHNEAKHHAATSLPAVSMDEFKRGGGSLTGREERQDFMQGEPKNFNDHRAAQDSKEGLRSGQHDSYNIRDGGSSGLRGEEQGLRGNESSLRGNNTAGGVGAGGVGAGAGAGAGGLGSSTHDSTSTTHSKPSLMDKLNPKKDADGDGKPGFMK